MKNNLINSKLPLLTIIYSVICIILIRPYNKPKEITSESIVISYANKTTDSNKLIIPKTQSPYNANKYTLSRGGTGDSDKESATVRDSNNNEDDLIPKKWRASSNSTIPKENHLLNAHLPDYFMYKDVNVSNLKDFLNSRNSLLAEEPYLSTILAVSKDFNLNPLVMFAITGQEQSFVPKSSENASKIANNPFNVFNSWKKYNTNIEDASTIAARTIVNLCKNRPNNMDAFTWVNKKYCEDKSWSKAVRSIFNHLEGMIPYLK